MYASSRLFGRSAVASIVTSLLRGRGSIDRVGHVFHPLTLKFHVSVALP